MPAGNFDRAGTYYFLSRFTFKKVPINLQE